MSTPERLSASQREEGLRRLPGWSLVGDAIERTYVCEDFPRAIAFVNAVARIAEAARHHPDLLVRWNRVTLTLTTHDAGGLTRLDLEVAAAADAAFTAR